MSFDVSPGSGVNELRFSILIADIIKLANYNVTVDFGYIGGNNKQLSAVNISKEYIKSFVLGINSLAIQKAQNNSFSIDSNLNIQISFGGYDYLNVSYINLKK